MKKFIIGFLIGACLTISGTASAYIVQKGDTFCGIARNFDIPCAELKTNNPHSDYNKIYPGEQINGSGEQMLGGLVTKPYTFSPSTVIRSSEINSNFDTLYNLANGNIDNNNISASANISASKILGTAVVTTPSGSQTIINAGATYSTIVRGVSGQTANIFDVQNASSTTILSVNLDGVNASNTVYFNTTTAKIWRDGDDLKFTDVGSGTTYTLTQLGTSVTFTEGDAIQITANKINVLVSSTTGMATDTNNNLYQKIKTDTGLEYATGSAGLHINTSTLITNIATSTPTASSIPIANASGTLNNGWLNVSTTPTANLIPVANASSTISPDWLSKTVSMSPLYSTSTSATMNYSYDCGFTPNLIKINYYITGKTTNRATFQYGILSYTSTSTLVNQVNYAYSFTGSDVYSYSDLTTSTVTTGGNIGYANWALVTFNLTTFARTSTVTLNLSEDNLYSAPQKWSFTCYK